MNTKEMLATSLKKLMVNESLDKITVTQVTNLCGINRQTFYYHFKDLYDLLYWILDHEEKKMLDNGNEFPPPSELVQNLYNYVISNEETICAIYYSLQEELLERYLADRIEKSLMIYFKNYPELRSVDEEILLEVCGFYKYAIIGNVFEWIRNGLGREWGDKVENIGAFIEQTFLNSVQILTKIKDNSNKKA